MTDGHCATASEVIFVQFSATGCPGADGSAAMPYCAPNDAVGVLKSTRHVIVVVGNTNGQMTLHSSGLSPVIIGRKNTAGTSGSIPANAAIAVTVQSDTVLIRDLTVNLGGGASSTGILVQGSGTNVTLLRVTASLGMGVGVEADTGTMLTMDSCTVSNNSMGGGILLNGAAFDIENTIVTNNGPGTFGGLTTWAGVLINMPPSSGPAKLHLLTVESNNQIGVSCSSDISAMVSGVLASLNAGGVQISPTCNFSSCGTAGPACGAQ